MKKGGTGGQIEKHHIKEEILLLSYSQLRTSTSLLSSLCPAPILLHLFTLSGLFCLLPFSAVDRCEERTPSFFMADIIKSIRRFLPLSSLPLPLFALYPLCTRPLSLRERWLFFLIAILIIINQLTAGHERGPLSVLSFPFCILHSLILSPAPILNH